MNQNKLSKSGIMTILRGIGNKGPHTILRSVWAKNQKNPLSDEQVRSLVKQSDRWKVDLTSDSAIFPQELKIDPVTGLLIGNDGQKGEWRDLVKEFVVRDEPHHKPRPQLFV